MSLQEVELDMHGEWLDEAKQFMQPHRGMFSDRLWLCADPSSWPLTPSPGPRVTYRTHFMVPDIMAKDYNDIRPPSTPRTIRRYYSGVAARVECIMNKKNVA